MAKIAAAASAGLIILLTACTNLFNPNEEYLQEKGRTVYRSANHAPPEEEAVPLPPRKVPGE